MSVVWLAKQGNTTVFANFFKVLSLSRPFDSVDIIIFYRTTIYLLYQNRIAIQSNIADARPGKRDFPLWPFYLLLLSSSASFTVQFEF